MHRIIIICIIISGIGTGVGVGTSPSSITILSYYFITLLFENPHSSFMHPLSLSRRFFFLSSSWTRATVVVRYYIYIAGVSSIGHFRSISGGSPVTMDGE
jgi:hypothetical protein